MCSCRENLPLQAEAPVWKEAPWSSVTGSVSLHFTQLLSILAGLSEAHGAGCCASAATDEDTSGRNGKTSTPSAFFSNSDVCLPWRSTWRYHFCFDDVGQSLVCVQSKLAYLGMPAAMQNKRKGKQALKWALKLSSWCSENKSHFAAKKKKKINWQQYSISLFPVSFAFTHTFALLCFPTNWHQLRRSSTCQMELPQGWPSRAPCSSCLTPGCGHLPCSAGMETGSELAAPPLLLLGHQDRAHSAVRADSSQAFPITAPALSSPPSSLAACTAPALLCAQLCWSSQAGFWAQDHKHLP